MAKEKSPELLLALSVFEGKRVYLVGPSQAAKVSPAAYRKYDLVARVNMSYTDKAQPRTDIFFLNKRSQVRAIRKKASILKKSVILVKHFLDTPRVQKAYPDSTVLQIYRHYMNVNKEIHGFEHNRKFVYMGTLAMYSLLEFGAEVRVGGYDFYMNGWCNKDNYPPGYTYFPEPTRTEEPCHNMGRDLKFIKNKLVDTDKYDGRLSFAPKTQRYYEQALKHYKID